MIDSGWFPLLGFLLLGSGLKTTLGFVPWAVVIPTDFGEDAGLYMARGFGWAVARAAEAVLLNPQDLGWVLRLLLLARLAGVLPLGPARLATFGGGGEGLKLGYGCWLTGWGVPKGSEESYAGSLG